MLSFHIIVMKVQNRMVILPLDFTFVVLNLDEPSQTMQAMYKCKTRQSGFT